MIFHPLNNLAILFGLIVTITTAGLRRLRGRQGLAIVVSVRILRVAIAAMAFTFHGMFVPISYGQKLDDSWTMTANGQIVQGDRYGGFTIPNVSAPDQFGPGGPGTRPDFVSDDYVRVLGVSTQGGSNRYAYSEFFKIYQGQTVTIQNLTFTDIPPKKPYAVTAIPYESSLTAIGHTTQVLVKAVYADNSSGDITAATNWTTYRASNVNVAQVDKDGLVTATGPGSVYITAENEGVCAVTKIFVQRQDPLSTIRGFVRFPDGSPAPGATVTLLDYTRSTTSTTDGSFAFDGVPTTTVTLTLRAALGTLRSPERPFPTVEGGIVDAGILVLEQPIVDVFSGTALAPGVAIGSGITFSSFPSLAGTVIADMTNALTQPYSGSSTVTMCFRGKTRRIPQYLVPSYQAAGGLIGPCPPPEAVETQTGRIRSMVVRRTDNGNLDFYYQIINENTVFQSTFDFFRLVILGISGTSVPMSFRNDGLIGVTGASNVSAGTRSPSTADRDFGSGGLGVSFSSFLGSPTNLRAGETSRFIVVRSSATGYGTTQALISTADTLFAQVFAPAAQPPPAASIDSDDDGFTDLKESIAGTDPRNAASVLRIGGIRTSAADVVLEFATVPGRTYAIECCTDLARGEWFVVQDQITGTGQPIQIQDLGAAAREPRCFYRLRVTLP